MLLDKIIEYFTKKDKGDKTEASPEGTCPTCWGVNEWDGEYYKVIKDKSVLPNSDVYTSFVNEIVKKHVSITKKQGDKYICTTCNKEI